MAGSRASTSLHAGTTTLRRGHTAGAAGETLASDRTARIMAMRKTGEHSQGRQKRTTAPARTKLTSCGGSHDPLPRGSHPGP